MKSNLFIIFLFSLVLFCTCKKKETTQSNGSGNGGYVETNTLLDLSNCYGEIHFDKDTSLGLQSGAVGTNIVELSFYSSPLTSTNNTIVNIGKVNMNGVFLKFAPGFGYNDTTRKLITLGSFTVNGGGEGQTTPIHLEYSGGKPNFADTNLIPSAINLAQGLNVNLTHISNADSVYVSLYDNKSHSINKNFVAKGLSSVNVVVSTSELNALVPDQGKIVMKVRMIKKSLVNYNSKDYLVYYNKAFTKFSVKLN